MFVRVTETVQDRGVLVHPDEVKSIVTNPEKDWYVSPFVYGEDALEYWEANKHSIRGYEGQVWTDSLYWDLDCKESFEKAHESALNLLQYLETLKVADGIEVYFSGNKGLHVFLRTKTKYTPEQTSMICYNIAVAAGVDKDVFDTTVYNVNRIFRIENTKHQASGLYKILLKDDEIAHMTEDEIRELAKKPRKLKPTSKPVKGKKLIAKFFIKPEPVEEKKNLRPTLVSVEQLLARTAPKETSEDVAHKGEADHPYGDFDPTLCPRGKRRCIYILENGYFGPGERENALIRIAAYYKGKDYDYEQTHEVLNLALARRAELYPDASEPKESDTHRILKEVFSDGWKGGTYSCREGSGNPDKYLQSKCDLGHGPCGDEHVKVETSDVVNISQLLLKYAEYGADALKEYPKTKLTWLDKAVRIRPRNFSLINGANGSGKTSLMNHMVKVLNEQKIYHLVFSMDMADTSLLEKLGATFTNYTPQEIESAFNIHTRDPQIIEAVAKALQEALPYSLFDFTSSVDSRHLEDTVMKLKKDYDIRIVFVDYAGRLIGDHDNEFANSSYNALAANDIAKRTNTHFVYLSQVSRQQGDHTKELRTSRVAKNSGTWEENATFIINVWRSFGDGLDDIDNYMHLYIAKNRTGPLGEQVYFWSGAKGTIREITRDEFQEYKELCKLHDKEPPYEQFQEENKKRREEAAAKSTMFNYEDNESEELPNSNRQSRFQKGS